MTNNQLGMLLYQNHQARTAELKLQYWRLLSLEPCSKYGDHFRWSHTGNVATSLVGRLHYERRRRSGDALRFEASSLETRQTTLSQLRIVDKHKMETGHTPHSLECRISVLPDVVLSTPELFMIMICMCTCT